VLAVAGAIWSSVKERLEKPPSRRRGRPLPPPPQQPQRPATQAPVMPPRPRPVQTAPPPWARKTPDSQPGREQPLPPWIWGIPASPGTDPREEGSGARPADGRPGTGTPAPGIDGVGREGIGSEGSRSEGFGTEGVRTEGFGTKGVGTEGVRTEGIPSEGVRPEVVPGQLQSTVRTTASPAPETAPQPEPPLAALLRTREGLAQAVLLAEVLGQPRALRPYRGFPQ